MRGLITAGQGSVWGWLCLLAGVQWVEDCAQGCVEHSPAASSSLVVRSIRSFLTGGDLHVVRRNATHSG